MTPPTNLLILGQPTTGGAATLIAHLTEALRQTNRRPRLLFVTRGDAAPQRRPTVLGQQGIEISIEEALRVAHEDGPALLIPAEPDHPGLADLLPLLTAVVRSEDEASAIVELRAALPCAPSLIAVRNRAHAILSAGGFPVTLAEAPFVPPAVRTSGARRLHAACLSRLRAGKGIELIVAANAHARADRRCALLGAPADPRPEGPWPPPGARGPFSSRDRREAVHIASGAVLVLCPDPHPGGLSYAAMEAIAGGALVVAPSSALAEMGLTPGEDAFAADDVDALAALLNATPGNRIKMAIAARRHLIRHGARAFTRAIEAHEKARMGVAP